MRSLRKAEETGTTPTAGVRVVRSGRASKVVAITTLGGVEYPRGSKHFQSVCQSRHSTPSGLGPCFLLTVGCALRACLRLLTGVPFGDRNRLTNFSRSIKTLGLLLSRLSVGCAKDASLRLVTSVPFGDRKAPTLTRVRSYPNRPGCDGR